jgi:hypothetical protein
MSDPFEIDDLAGVLNNACEKLRWRWRVCAACRNYFKAPVCEATEFIGAALKCYTCLRVNDPPNQWQTPEYKEAKMRAFLKLFDSEARQDDETQGR